MHRISYTYAVSLIGILTFASLGIVLQRQGVAQPPVGGKYKDCSNPVTYPDPSGCNPDEDACYPLHMCLTPPDGYPCPGEDDCDPAACPQFKATEAIGAGFCDVDPIYGAGRCIKCEWLACAKGNAYKDAMDCFMGVNAQCTAIGWKSDTCKTGP